MRKSIVLTLAGGAGATMLLASVLSAPFTNPAKAKPTAQCWKETTSCRVDCVRDNGGKEGGSSLVRTCWGNCDVKELKCLGIITDWGKRPEGDKGKGGKRGQGVVSDPVRPPKPPVGEQPPAKGPQSTGTWTTAPAGNTGPSVVPVKDPASKTPPSPIRELLTKPFGGTYRP
jgi:hypothetical protein